VTFDRLCCAPLTPLVARAQGNTTPEAGTDYVVLKTRSR